MGIKRKAEPTGLYTVRPIYLAKVDREETVQRPDYDWAAYYAENGGQGDNGHYPDRYKEPTHITYSKESTLHGGQYLGGRWIEPSHVEKEWTGNEEPVFVPSAFNQEMYEPWDYAGYSEATGERVLIPEFGEGGQTSENKYFEYQPSRFEDGGWLDKGKELVRKIVDSEARNAPVYSDIPYGKAFNDARRKGYNTFYWNDQYYNTNLHVNPFADNGVMYDGSNWTNDMYEQLMEKVDQSGIGFTMDDIARVIGEESSYNKFASKGSYVGPMQFGIDWLSKIYGSGAANGVYNQYKTNTRTDNDIVNDIVGYLQKLDENIKTERDKMTYGRLKVNQYAPNSSLDSKVSNAVWKNNLKYEIDLGRLSKDIKPGVSTYRQVMESYDELKDK